MTRRRVHVMFSAVLAAVVFASSGWAQVPAGSPTLWSFLGIPQGVRRMQNAFRNPRGNFPGAEKGPPRLPLDAPELLESPDPALKAAAEIAQQEKLKMQKIKAVKFLLSIGCACYDKDGKITEAIVAKSDDCTEEVRLVTVQQIKEAAENQCCSNCGSTCCCNETVIKRLAEMAYHRDETGCFIEPSERVREAAIEALAVCCPDTSPVIEDYPEEEIDTPSATTTVPEGGDEDVAPAPEGGLEDELDSELEELERGPIDVDEAAHDRSLEYRHVDASRKPRADEKNYPGQVVHVDLKRNAAHLHLNNLRRPVPVGTELRVQVIGPDNATLAGRLRVYESFPDSVNVTAIDQASVAVLEVGAIIQRVSAWQVTDPRPSEAQVENRPVPPRRQPVKTAVPRPQLPRVVKLQDRPEPQPLPPSRVSNLAPVVPVSTPAPVVTKESPYRGSSRRNWSSGSMVSLRTLLNSSVDE